MITLTGLTPPQICACSKAGFGFPMSYVVVLFMSHDLMWEVIVRFVDIGRIADHNGLNFLSISNNASSKVEQWQMTRVLLKLSQVYEVILCLFLGICCSKYCSHKAWNILTFLTSNRRWGTVWNPKIGIKGLNITLEIL